MKNLYLVYHYKVSLSQIPNAYFHIHHRLQDCHHYALASNEVLNLLKMFLFPACYDYLLLEDRFSHHPWKAKNPHNHHLYLLSKVFSSYTKFLSFQCKLKWALNLHSGTVSFFQFSKSHLQSIYLSCNFLGKKKATIVSETNFIIYW